MLLLLLAALGFAFWRITRHQECSFLGEPEGRLVDHLPAIAGATHGHLVGGNAVELIEDAAFFERLCSEIDEADHTVHIETFLWKDGEVSDQVIAALIKAQSRGVKVRIVVDARGGKNFSDTSRDRLRDAGCELHIFRPWRWWNLGKLNVRTHRKIAVFDGKTALIGGHCIDDDWVKGKDGRPPFHDISGVVKGPVVAQVQSTFFENWQVVTDDIFTDEATFPPLEPAGEAAAHVAYVQADGCPSAVQTLHYAVMAYAKERLWIQNPYFLPEKAGRAALIQAAKRGVDVRVMTPAVETSDVPYVQRASQHLYGELLQGGVRIFEYQPTLPHQKVMTVDGEWIALGSSNFDDRSFEINDEITMGIADSQLARQLEENFERDMEDCEELTYEKWNDRSPLERLLHAFHFLFKEQM